MAIRAFQFTATIPASTPASALAVIPLALDNWEVEAIDLEVPPGPAGLMGFYIAHAGVQWIPQGAGQFVVWDNRAATWYFTDQPNAQGWAVVGYNTDTAYSHSVIVRFHVSPPTTAPQQLPAVTIQSGPTLAVAGTGVDL